MALKRAATDPGTDYSNAQTVKFVDEHALDQFSIIEDIMKSMAQTHYADAENLNKGPYKAMVTQPGNDKGSASKQLQPWIVDSKMTTENGKDVNVVQVWIDDTQDGQPRTIKAQMKIFASATKKADGSYKDYGVWTLNAGMGDGMSFTAEASIGPNGEAIVKVHDIESHGGGTVDSKGILDKSDTSGFGKVDFPDFSNCHSPNCTPTVTEAKYVYDANHVAIQVGSNTEFKDRNSVTDMVQRYGMYDSVTGADVLKTHSFGFPVTYTDTNGVQQFAYYGAWQGRHQLWANGATVPAGTTVTRADRNSNQTAETYKVSNTFLGDLVKRTLVTGDINDIKNIPVQIWVNINYQLQWNGSQWIKCINPDFHTFPPTCGAGSGPISDFSFLVANPNDTQKFIMISRWAPGNPPQETDYVYDPNGASGAGFYVATRNQNGGFTSTGR